MNQQLNPRIPVYLKGGFNVRDRDPIGFAETAGEAVFMMRAIFGRRTVGANGNEARIVISSAEKLGDDSGSYFVPVMNIREY